MPDNILFTETQIQEKVQLVAKSVNAWLNDLSADQLHVVSILEGAKPFTGDLLDHLHKYRRDLEIILHEVRIKGTDGTKLLKQRIPQSGFPQIQGSSPILLVDDLVDSGMTLWLLRDALVSLKNGPVKTAVLLRKFGEASGPVDFFGFDLAWTKEALAEKGLDDCWLYGYGMDLNGHQRDLRHIKTFQIKKDQK